MYVLVMYHFFLRYSFRHWIVVLLAKLLKVGVEMTRVNIFRRDVNTDVNRYGFVRNGRVKLFECGKIFSIKKSAVSVVCVKMQNPAYKRILFLATRDFSFQDTQ